MSEVIGASRLHATNRLIARFVGPEASVAEIGANDASFRRFHEYRQWTTVDKYGSPDVRADLDGLGAHLPFETSSIDCVVCTEVLEHLAMGTPLVKEIGRVLRPGGAAVVSVPNICSLKSRLKVLTGRLPNMAASGDCGHPLGGTGVLVDGNWVAGHLVDFNFDRLRGYLVRGGLTIVDHVALPVPIHGAGFRFTVPAGVMPRGLCDFVLVAATKS